MGELATWEKISAIECNCTIEATLDKCVQKLTNQVSSSKGLATGVCVCFGGRESGVRRTTC